ncbi:uncharacterized protein [Amphiura filiformis]|uniref:uncharacterized protein n=1 Tax=Amphiura filiformis TaxID=82378 RepID=UPI003B21D4C0
MSTDLDRIQCQFGGLPIGGGIEGNKIIDCYQCGQNSSEQISSSSSQCTDPSNAQDVPTEECSGQCYAHTWFNGSVAYAERGCDTPQLKHCSSVQSCSGTDCWHCCSESNCNVHDPTEIQDLSLQWSHCYECIQNDTWDVCSKNGFNPYDERVSFRTCHSGICAIVDIPPIELVGLEQKITIRKCDVPGSTYEACHGESDGSCHAVDIGAILGFPGFPGIDPAQACCCSGHYCNGPWKPTVPYVSTTPHPSTLQRTTLTPTTSTEATKPTTKKQLKEEVTKASVRKTTVTVREETGSSGPSITTSRLTSFCALFVILIFVTVGN